MATTSACARPCCLAPAWNESVHQFRLSLRCTGTGVARDAACREGKLSPVGLLQVHVPDRMSGLAGMLRRRRHVITEYLPQPWISACGGSYLHICLLRLADAETECNTVIELKPEHHAA